MTDYGKGAVLGAAILPATSATGFMFVDNVHPAIIIGFIIINILWTILLVGHISRYLINRKAK